MLVRAAQQFGFPPRDIAAFFRVRDSGGKPCHDVRDAGQQMLNALDAEMAGPRARRRQIQQTLREWDQILARTPANQPAHLLEALSGWRYPIDRATDQAHWRGLLSGARP